MLEDNLYEPLGSNDSVWLLLSSQPYSRVFIASNGRAKGSHTVLSVRQTPWDALSTGYMPWPHETTQNPSRVYTPLSLSRGRLPKRVTTTDIDPSSAGHSSINVKDSKLDLASYRDPVAGHYGARLWTANATKAGSTWAGRSCRRAAALSLATSRTLTSIKWILC